MQQHHLTFLIGNLDADHILAGNIPGHAHADRRHRAGQIILQGDDSIDLGAGGRFEFKLGHHGAGVHRNHLALNPIIEQFLLQHARNRLQRRRIVFAFAAFAAIKNIQRRQLVAGTGRLLECQLGLLLLFGPARHAHPGRLAHIGFGFGDMDRAFFARLLPRFACLNTIFAICSFGQNLTNDTANPVGREPQPAIGCAQQFQQRPVRCRHQRTQQQGDQQQIAANIAQPGR